jgi:nitrate/TMAO reductase-like tetraheme cytochrome c subunit
VKGFKMKLSEMQEVFIAYERAIHSPSRSGVRFGCVCGCGGDFYTSESWDAEEQAAADAIVAMKTFCVENNIEYDEIEE